MPRKARSSKKSKKKPYSPSRRVALALWWVFGMPLCCIWVVAFALGGWKRFKGHYFLDWNNLRTTTGTVTASQVNYRTHSSLPFYSIAYTYTVADEKYQSDLVRFDGVANDSDTLNFYFRKYPVGKMVVVYYDKTQPSFAALEPHKGEGNVVDFILLFFPLLLYVGFTSFILSVMKFQMWKA